MDIENVPANLRSPGQNIEKIYQKKTQLEHILLRPDTYIGSVERESEFTWVYDDEEEKMVQRKVSFVPGLYKIFDEILVNAADNKQRDPSMDKLKVEIDVTAGSISVYNNGKGIPVVKHNEVGVYVPELIFSHLLTSSNYNDNEKKTVGGRNGYGAKLANIFSTEFTVETNDSKRGKFYSQSFFNNMTKRGAPKITKAKGKDWTRITFFPDFAKFGMLGFDEDILGLLRKRVFDVAGTASKGLKVYLNDAKLPVRSFEEYVGMYLPEDCKTHPRVFAVVNDRWQICVSSSDGHFQQVSFVNNIATIKGGTHVKHVTDQLSQMLLTQIKKKHKNLALKPHHIKNHLCVFVNAYIENPSFDSQTKVYLTLREEKFGSSCPVSDDLVKKVMKSNVVESVLTWAKFKQSKELKKTDGKKSDRVAGIPKLEDANWAGTRHSKKCTLILTEGDSAKALAVAGLSIVGRDAWGVFPLRGKLLNVRDASSKQIAANEELKNLKKIIGLKHGMEYEDIKSLRYGRIMLMTDQDHDGSHIKGLIINMFQCFWPSLLQMPGFLVEFITPIVKCTKGARSHSFFTIPEYEAWRAEQSESAIKGWKIKYYKGLGTSTAREGKEYFSNLDDHVIDFAYGGDEDDESVVLAFSKKAADARKQWLRTYQPGSYLDMNVDKLSYADFVNKELILFSIASNKRAIPSVVDGLKPGQRKILYGCFKMKKNAELKVDQLAGYVSRHAAYHHGEASLFGTIIAMAQNYVGSNNINLLYPNGQFGTRHQSGKDAASARYIFTFMSAITRALFNPLDDNVLKYLDDDGMLVEPEWYMPVVPTVLVNGSAGIGTGWSSNIPNFNPRDISANIRRMLDGKEPETMHPWYKGFKGEIVLNAKGTSYNTFGRIAIIDDDTLEITELPIGKATLDYKLFLESLIEKGLIKMYREYHTDSDVRFECTLTPENMAIAENDDLYKVFKLKGSIALSNMVLFDANNRLKRYRCVEDILKDFFALRLEYYQRRKDHMAKQLTEELTKLCNKARFICAVVDGELELRNRQKQDIVDELVASGYAPLKKKGKKNHEMSEEEHDDADADADADEDMSDEKQMGQIEKGDFDYLLSMKLWSLTKEKVATLTAERDAKEAELDELLSTGIEDMWKDDLDEFEAALEAHEAEENSENEADRRLVKRAKPKSKSKVTKSKAVKSKAVKPKMVQPKVVKPKATKPKVVKPKAAKPKATKPKVAKVKKALVMESEDDEEVEEVPKRPLSLAERLELRKKQQQAKAKKPVAKAAVVDDDDDDDDQDDVDSLPKPRASRKRTHTAKTASTEFARHALADLKLSDSPSKTPKPKRVCRSVLDDSSDDDSDFEEQPVKSKKKTKKTKKVVAKSKTKSKKKKAILSDSEDDDFIDLDEDDDMLDSPLVPLKKRTPRVRRAAARRAITYAVDTDDDGEEEEDDDEDDDEEEEEYFEEEDDSESEFDPDDE
jgi:DNA topoisomerase II